MTKLAKNIIRNSVPAIILTALFLAPVGAFAFSQGAGAAVDKSGAGLVLYVTLQRNAMGG